MKSRDPTIPCPGEAELSFWFFWLSSTLVICPPLFSATQSSSGRLQYFTSVNWEPAEVQVVHGCH